jgi:hypothetical protein
VKWSVWDFRVSLQVPYCHCSTCSVWKTPAQIRERAERTLRRLLFDLLLVCKTGCRLGYAWYASFFLVEYDIVRSVADSEIMPLSIWARWICLELNRLGVYLGSRMLCVGFCNIGGSHGEEVISFCADGRDDRFAPLLHSLYNK